MTNRDRVEDVIKEMRSMDHPVKDEWIADRLAAEGLIAPDPEAIRAKIMTANKRLQPHELDALVKALT